MKTNETGSQFSSKDGMAIARACWEIIVDNLSKSGWSWSCVSAVDSGARTIFVADAHRDDGKRFIVRADEKLSVFVELQVAIRDRGFSLTYVSYFGSLGTQKQSWIGQGHQFLSVKRLA